MTTIVGEALRCQRVSGSAKLILVALADCANDAGVSWPSLAYLAQVATLHPRNVQRLIVRLEQLGLVVRGDRPGRSTVYQLQREAFRLPLLDPEPSRGRRGGGRRTHGSSATPGTTAVGSASAASRGSCTSEPTAVVPPLAPAPPLTLPPPTHGSSAVPVQITDPSRNLSTHTSRAREASTTARATSGRGEHRAHAWCSARVCVPTFLHQELCGQHGGIDAHGALRAWYPTVVAGLSPTDPVPDALRFWREAFRAWQRPADTSTETATASRRPARAPAHRIPAGFGPSVGPCEHDPPCAHYDDHRLRWLDEERVREGLPPRASTAARATRDASPPAVA